MLKLLTFRPLWDSQVNIISNYIHYRQRNLIHLLKGILRVPA